MLGVQNINYYLSFFSSLSDVKKRQEQASLLRTLMNPLDRATRIASSVITDYFLLPLVKETYSRTGAVAVVVTGLVSERLANWVRMSWNDPISTKSLLNVGRTIEQVTKASATSTPTEWPILEAIDKCRISLARHLYIVAKDFNSILRIPGSLRDYVNWTTVDTTPEDEIEPSTIGQKGWILFKQGTAAISNVLMALIAKVIDTVSIPLQHIPYLQIAISWIGCKIDEARNHIHKSVIKKAHNVIDSHEATIRKAVVGKLGVVAVRSFANELMNFGVKFYLAREIYQFVKEGLTQISGSEELPELVITLGSVTMKVAGMVLLMRTVAPTIERLHDDYKQDFDTEASTLKELGSLVNRHNLPRILSFIKKYFHSKS